MTTTMNTMIVRENVTYPYRESIMGDKSDFYEVHRNYGYGIEMRLLYPPGVDPIGLLYDYFVHDNTWEWDSDSSTYDGDRNDGELDATTIKGNSGQDMDWMRFWDYMLYCGSVDDITIKCYELLQRHESIRNCDV